MTTRQPYFARPLGTHCTCIFLIQSNISRFLIKNHGPLLSGFIFRILEIHAESKLAFEVLFWSKGVV
jgi:hypothetical protein